MCQLPQEALDFIATPLVANHNTITDHITDEKSHMAQIDRVWISIAYIRVRQEWKVTRFGVDKNMVQGQRHGMRETTGQLLEITGH